MDYDIAVVGAGYVGLPLSATFAEAGCHVLLVDVVESVVDGLNRGETHIEDVESARWAPLIDPGREDWTTKTTPKVLGGITPECTRRAADVYRRAIDEIVEVSTPEAAELTKLLENIFRSVNIALVNEL